jgi:hypothetical protein
MTNSAVFLRQIRKMYGVPAFHNMPVETRTGAPGFIDGADGTTLRIYMGYKKPFGYFNPDELIYITNRRV